MNSQFDMNHESSNPLGRGRRGHGRGRVAGPGREGSGKDHEGFGPEHDGAPEGRGRGRGHHGRPHGQRGGRRRNRGDVRIAVLLLLAEEPMHGYQLMQTITDRTNGAWAPSPGAIYPTLSLLEDESLVSVTLEGGRKLATLTEAGQQHVTENRDSWPNPFESEATDGVNLRDVMAQLTDAVRAIDRTGKPDQRAKAAELLDAVRKDIYLLLAEQ